jgi:hypothetical protein
MSLSQANRVLGVGVTASSGDEEPLMQSAEVESTVEAVGECRQVSSGILPEVECMIATGRAGLEIAQDGVDPLELRQVFRLSSGDDGWLMDAPGFGDGSEAGQTIRRHGAARSQMRLGPGCDGLEGEAHRQTGSSAAARPAPLSIPASADGPESLLQNSLFSRIFPCKRLGRGGQAAISGMIGASKP